MFRVRKTWADVNSQLGAYKLLGFAKKMADKHPGYFVFDKKGKVVYPIYASYSGSVVKLGTKKCTVLNQHKRTGPWKAELGKHGCGVSCAAFAARLVGVPSITPESMMLNAVRIFNKTKKGQIYAISTAGIVTILKKKGLKPTRRLVTKENRAKIQNEIDDALRCGKPVICWTTAYDKADPFAGGHHYILAVGYNSKGAVVIANSGGKGPVQTVSLDTLCKYINHDCSGKDKTWCSSASASAGIVIVSK